MIQETKKILGYSVFAAFIMTTLVFASVWFIAPEVGGKWWPYIRFVVSIIPAIIIGRVALSITAQALTARFMSHKAHDVFRNGSEDSPWSEEDIEEFVSQFQNNDSGTGEE